MRALVITSTEPLGDGPKIGGTYWRFRLFLQAISEIAHQIDLVHFVSNQFLLQNARVAAAISAEESTSLGVPLTAHLIGCRPPRPPTFRNYYLSGLFSIFDHPEFHWYTGDEQVAKLTSFLDRAPDMVFVHRLNAMVSLLRSGRRPERLFFDIDDIAHRVRMQVALRPPVRPGKLGDLCRVPAIIAAERCGAARSRLAFVCSEADRNRLRRLGFPRIAVVPNALPFPPEPPDLPNAATILFLASWHYPPNVLAGERLTKRIFPRIRVLVPEAQLLIAGQGSVELGERWGPRQGVRYLGYVDDLTALYRESRVVCCPITGGSGTRLKLIEAAGYGRPIVATRFAAEGLDLRDGREILYAEDDAGIAAACAELLRDHGLCRTLGAAARRRVTAMYDTTSIKRAITRLMTEAVVPAVTSCC